MSSATVILCPGQGAQQVGMGKAWAERFPESRQVFERADAALGFSISKLCFEGPAPELERTDNAQPALYVAAVACHAALVAQGKLDPAGVVGLAGLSLGEFTALHLAGAFSFEDGLRLVRLRGQAMQEAATAAPSGMVAMIRGDEDKVRKLCDAVREGDVLVPANFNAPGQIVVSGSKAACDRAVARAKEFEMVGKALQVAGAFHSPLMAPAAQRLAVALEQAAWRPLTAPVLSNVTGRPHDNDPAKIKALLVQQLTNPVRWAESMAWATGPGAWHGRYVELCPNTTLAGLMKRINKDQAVESHDQPA